MNFDVFVFQTVHTFISMFLKFSKLFLEKQIRMCQVDENFASVECRDAKSNFEGRYGEVCISLVMIQHPLKNFTAPPPPENSWTFLDKGHKINDSKFY